MRWLLVCLCVGAAVGIELRCDSPLCSVRRSHYKPWLNFNVEGDIVEIKYTQSYFYVNCHKWQALDSLAMPHFTSEFSASTVVLADCPLPATRNGSLVQALSALNITMQPIHAEIYLKIVGFPLHPQLASHYFSGLEHLTNLTIKSFDTASEPPAGFFAELPNLRSLELRGVRLPAGELYRLPRTLKSLDLGEVSMEILPDSLTEAVSETLLALPDLRALTLQQRESASPVAQTTNKNDSKLQTNAKSLLEELTLYFWKEKQLPVLQQCDDLRSFGMSKSFSPVELPDRFIAACPRVEELRVIAVELKPLPARLLENAATLKHLYLLNCEIQSLPEGFFQGAPNLIKLDLRSNSLQTLPSGVFLGLSLQSLALSQNQLNNTVLKELVTLTSLTTLNLASNHFSEICDDNGYSPLSNLTQLRQLDVSYNSNLTRICRDWRENLTLLDTLNLNSDRIRLLRFADFQYTRDPSVKNSIVTMEEWTVYVIFTEDDYKTALAAPETGATLRFVNKLEYIDYFEMDCDCSMYWFRRALDEASHAIKFEGVACKNNLSFKGVTPEEMCPELKATTTSEKP